MILVIGHSRMAGTELQTFKLQSKLKEKGICTELWILERSGQLDQISSKESRIVNFPIFNESFHGKLFNFVKLVIQVGKNRNSIIQTQLVGPSILVYLATLFLPYPIIRIVGIRGRISRRNSAVEFITKKCIKSANGLIVNSPHLMEEISSRFAITNQAFAVIPNGVEPAYKIANTGIAPPRAVVLANFISYKGHKELIEIISRNAHQVKYTFFGQGPLESDLKQKIKEERMEEFIEIRHDSSSNFEFLSQFQFAVHPSETEGLSNAILEEIASGLPVIAFNVGGNSLLIENGENGFLIDDLNYYSFAEKIELLAENTKKRVQMGKKSLRKSKEFEWGICVDRHILFYNKCIADSR